MEKIFKMGGSVEKQIQKALGSLLPCGNRCRFSESAICSSRVHPPSEIKSNFKFKTLRWRPLRWRLTLSEYLIHILNLVGICNCVYNRNWFRNNSCLYLQPREAPITDMVTDLLKLTRYRVTDIPNGFLGFGRGCGNNLGIISATDN